MDYSLDDTQPVSAEAMREFADWCESDRQRAAKLEQQRGHDPYNHTGEAFASYERNEREAWAALKRTLCSESLPLFFRRQAS